MGKTADLTVVQKTIIDTLHKEGKTQTFIVKEAGCSQSAVSKHVNRKLSGRKKCGRKRWCWSIVFSENHVTAPVYQDILEHFMLPSADQLFKDADFIFQQDLAPAHTAKSTNSWLNDHGVGVDWPANSPDLNIENIWSIVKRKMRNKRPKHADELKATVKEPGLHTTSAVPQTDHLHATPNWGSN